MASLTKLASLSGLSFSVFSLTSLVASPWVFSAPVINRRASSSELIVRFQSSTYNSATPRYNSLIRGMNHLGVRGLKFLSVAGQKSSPFYKLNFETLADRDQALKRLKSAPGIASVTINHLYYPTLHMNSRFTALAQTGSGPEGDNGPKFPVNGFPIPHLPIDLSRIAPPGIPDVLLPPASEVAGVDALSEKDWAISAINLPELGKSTANDTVTVAVIDTGVDYNHEDLVSAMWRSPTNPKEVGWDYAHNNSFPFDKVHFQLEECLKDFICAIGIDSSKYLVNPGHGTHCAGHVAAVAGNSKGIQGAGAGAKIMALKFFYDAGEQNAGSGDDAAAIQSIDYAINNGAKIISASWGGNMTREEAMASDLFKAMQRAKDAGVLFVVAAGNDGLDFEGAAPQPDEDGTIPPQQLVSYPAGYSNDLDNVLVVAATNSANQLANFSNYGATLVHVGAPGVKIFSTTSGGTYSDLVASAGGMTIDWDGTSMATPIVAGAAAAIWAKYPNLTYLDVKNRILNNVKKFDSLTGKISTGGVLDVSAALQ